VVDDDDDDVVVVVDDDDDDDSVVVDEVDVVVDVDWRKRWMRSINKSCACCATDLVDGDPLPW
jgi:hypothetical protein